MMLSYQVRFQFNYECFVYTDVLLYNSMEELCWKLAIKLGKN